MRIIDTHCDALYKLRDAKYNRGHEVQPVSYRDMDTLDTNLTRLQQGGVQAQFFAIFIEPDIPSDQKWQAALEQIDIFYEDVLRPNPQLKHIRNWQDLDALHADEVGAVLALEGADAFGNDLAKLRELYRAGVLSIGLTWNNANLCADGVGESRGAGLTDFGREVIRLNNEHNVLSDVAHLSERGFWDLIEIADYPIASHSNARALCDHPRNLTDEQAKAIFAKGGTVHVVFYPGFINAGGNAGQVQATIADLIRHIDHFCALGGVNHLGFGSDFDGIPLHPDGLRHAGEYQNLINELLKHYSEAEVAGFAGRNFLERRPR